MNFANVGGLAATVGDAVAMFALRIEVSAATLPVAALLSRAGYEVLGFWLVCQLGRIMCSRDFHSRRHSAISSLHSLLAFVLCRSVK